MSFPKFADLCTFFKQTCPTILADDPFPNISIDSRSIQPGTNTLFIALKGEKADGHEYVSQAADLGAIGAICSKEYAEKTSLDLPKDFFLIPVENTHDALINLAKWYRTQFTLPVIGVTGSCGKTTVKEMIAQILEGVGPTLKNKGNFNNEIGLPLTVLNLKPTHQFAVIEMGARHVGDIEVLSSIAKPTLSVVTLVAPAHIEIFKKIDNIAIAKGEIYHGLPKEGFAIVNRDEPYSDYFIRSCINAKLVTFSLSSGTDYFATDIKLHTTFTEFVLHTPFGKAKIALPIPGVHNVSNALAAASLAGALGIKLTAIQSGLENFSTITGRMQIKQHEAGATIIDDTYNANPRSLMAAMAVLSNYPGKKYLILGDMGELGEEAPSYHAQMGLEAKKLGIDKLFTVGKLTEHATKAFGEGAVHLASQIAVVETVQNLIDKNCTVLVKGSRSAGMEKIVQALIAKSTEGQAPCLAG